MWFYSVYNSLRRIAKRHIDFTLYTDFHYFKHFITKKNWPSFYLPFTSVIQTCLVPFFVLIYDVEWKAIESTTTLCTWYLTRVGENESLFSFPMQDVTLVWNIMKKDYSMNVLNLIVVNGYGKAHARVLLSKNTYVTCTTTKKFN